jgi:hypothetical protein
VKFFFLLRSMSLIGPTSATRWYWNNL